MLRPCGPPVCTEFKNKQAYLGSGLSGKSRPLGFNERVMASSCQEFTISPEKELTFTSTVGLGLGAGRLLGLERGFGGLKETGCLGQRQGLKAEGVGHCARYKAWW